MPVLASFEGIKYQDKVSQFIRMSKIVGGNAVLLEEGADANLLIKSLYPEAKKIVSNLSEITIATSSGDEIDHPEMLNGTDLGIVRGELGVVENGCVWMPKNVKERALYFISEYLVILLNRKNLVHNMHEAYDHVNFHNEGFGVFISGPSKTADIEQSLVVGAHGARGVTVILL